jgi:hypothetical protein
MANFAGFDVDLQAAERKVSMPSLFDALEVA